ncbi:POK18 protein, partial [Syrrhaptes paradoxus]|nr:POK18 protein [Syrrhaptes paradoxus]
STSPQKLWLANTTSTLNDLQKLLGTTNRIRPMLGISTAELRNLFNSLKGDSDLNSP